MSTTHRIVDVAVHLESGLVSNAARAYLGDIAAAACAFEALAGCPAERLGELLVGVMDRETRCGTAVSKVDGSTGPSILHDDRHGHGLFGADDRSHPQLCALVLPDGTRAIHNPGIAALAAASELAADLHRFGGNEDAALDAYNGGPGRVAAALAAGKDPDSVTSGSDHSPIVGDYGKDTLARAAAFYPPQP